MSLQYFSVFDKQLTYILVGMIVEVDYHIV